MMKPLSTPTQSVRSLKINTGSTDTLLMQGQDMQHDARFHKVDCVSQYGDDGPLNILHDKPRPKSCGWIAIS